MDEFFTFEAKDVQVLGEVVFDVLNAVFVVFFGLSG
jgi:hypothetical protein